MIQIRNVSDETHLKLVEKAKDAGMSLSDLLKVEIEKIANQLTADELTKRLADRSNLQITDEEVLDALDEGRSER